MNRLSAASRTEISKWALPSRSFHTNSPPSMWYMPSAASWAEATT